MIYTGHVLDILPTLPAQSVQCCVTSPPYWGLRNYGVAGQIGLEPTPEAYVATMVQVFLEVKRVLKDGGTLWLNLGDSYSGSGKGGNPEDGKQATNKGSQSIGVLYGKTGETAREAAVTNVGRRLCAEHGIQPKQLLGIPWRVALALQADGWILRSDIIWHKPNPMPESVKDRPTKAHEYVFMFAKQGKYYYDAEAIAEQIADSTAGDSRLWRDGYETGRPERQYPGSPSRGSGLLMPSENNTRNARSVWTIATQPYKDAHFATFPEALPRRCILAGTKPGDTVLDPFFGAGTTGLVAVKCGRHYVGIELNPTYAAMAQARIEPHEAQTLMELR